MKTTLHPIITILITAIILLASCNVIGESGSGNVVREERHLSDFNSIDVSGAYHIFLTQGSTQSVIVEADDNLMKLIRTSVNGNTLVIENKEPIRNAKTMNIYLTIPDLKEISLSGAVDVETQSKFTMQELAIDVSGSTDSRLDLDVQRLKIESSGGSKLTLSGLAKEVGYDISGSVDLFAYDLAAEKVVLDISGAGKAEISVSSEFSADVSGAATVRYKGNPAKISQEISGAGSIKKAE